MGMGKLKAKGEIVQFFFYFAEARKEQIMECFIKSMYNNLNGIKEKWFRYGRIVWNLFGKNSNLVFKIIYHYINILGTLKAQPTLL